MSTKKKEFIDKLDLNCNKNVAIIGSSICSCLLGDYLKSEFGVKVIFYEKSKFIGGAWRKDKFGNIFSNILAPITAKERKIFNKSLKFLDSKSIKSTKMSLQSFYAGQLVDSYLFDFNNFYKKIKREHIFRKLKVNSINENYNHILINNKYKHDYIFFPNYVDLKYIKKNSSPRLTFKIPMVKVIKSKHLRILCTKKVKDKFKNLFYSNEKFGPLDRLQIIKLKQNIYKISGRISIDSKNRSKSFLVNKLSILLDIKNIVKTSINSYSSFYYSKSDIKKIDLINNKFDRVKHYDTQSVLGFINKYLI